MQITTGQVILMTLVEDSLRGRVMALYGVHWALLPWRAMMNSIAERTGAPSAVAGAGVALVAVALAIALLGAALRNVALPQAEPART